MKAIERLYQYIDYKGFKAVPFEKEVGLSNGYLGKQLKRTADLGESILNKIIENCPDINPLWLLTGHGEMLKKNTNIVNEPALQYQITKKNEIPLIPIDAKAGNGNGEFQIAEKDITEHYVIPEFTYRGVEFMIKASGDSMEPTYRSGDLLGCKKITDLSFFQWGRAYLLDTTQGLMVKRLYAVNDNAEHLECRSDNTQKHPTFPIKKTSIYSIAIVLGVVRME